MLAAEKELEHLGETHGCEDYQHDMIHELSRRLDSVWRCDQYIANADGHPEMQDFWRKLKQDELNVVQRLKELLRDEVHAGGF